jgi:hypothetical protein
MRKRIRNQEVTLINPQFIQRVGITKPEWVRLGCGFSWKKGSL